MQIHEGYDGNFGIYHLNTKGNHLEILTGKGELSMVFRGAGKKSILSPSGDVLERLARMQQSGLGDEQFELREEGEW